jgi:hypothetical protein
MLQESISMNPAQFARLKDAPPALLESLKDAQ